MQNMKKLIAILAVALAGVASARDYHVAVTGNNAHDGSPGKPLKTIQAAADLAQPDDTVTVHAGVYRERVNPPRGGNSDVHRITYQAAPGEKVVITGSEQVNGWEKVTNDTWKVTLPNAFFGGYNPYKSVIRGDWFGGNGRTHHTGSVYVNGDWHDEAAKHDDALNPAGKILLWFGQVDATNTTIWAQFPAGDPNREQVEINVRPTVFTPTKTGINYITVRGFTMRNAATTWAPPTAGQIGLITAYWSKGWIIENNDIGYSRCVGVALGKYSDEWDNRAGSASGYVGTIHRALKNAWNKETVGSHIVRNNHIHHCEQTGIVGSLGCAFSTITGNTIHDVQVRKLFGGAEMGGIKFHGAIDVVIAGNHIYRTDRGIWLDWMAQGAQVAGNLLHDNGEDREACQDLFLEVDHGPILVANNILLSQHSHWMQSQGIAYAHNLFAGTLNMANSSGAVAPDPRGTPYFKPHSTELVGLHGFKWGDVRYYNNLFTYDASRRKKSTSQSRYSNDHMIPNVGFDLNRYQKAALPVAMAGNVYLKDAPPYAPETNAIAKADFNPAPKLIEKPDGWYLELTLDKAWTANRNRPLVTTALLGKAIIPDQPFENADGTSLRIDTDYLGNRRDTGNPFPGPFEIIQTGTQTIKVWPKQ
jgi:alpha-N-arabinofuranosidase